nr:class I tRNA ligase family protein [Frankia gtarii]
MTPAHDPNDFVIGQRHDLPTTTMMDERGIITTHGPFQGLGRFEARSAILAALRTEGRIVADVHAADPGERVNVRGDLRLVRSRQPSPARRPRCRSSGPPRACPGRSRRPRPAAASPPRGPRTHRQPAAAGGGLSRIRPFLPRAADHRARRRGARGRLPAGGAASTS